MQATNIDNPLLPLDWFFQWCEKTPNATYLKQPIDGNWHSYSWNEVANIAQKLVLHLQAKGFNKGDKIAILSKNCAHWIITDIALQMGGYVSVPLFPDQSAENLRFILEDAEVKAVFIGKIEKPSWERYKDVLPENVSYILFPFLGALSDCQKQDDLAQHTTWSEILYNEKSPLGLTHNLTPQDIWTLLYTSGTSGLPKGVIHTYDGVSKVREHLQETLGFTQTDRFFSYLPLAHAAERMLLGVNSLFFGISIAFAESLSSFQSDLQHAKPTVFFSVPRIWKKLQLGVLEKLPQKKLNLLLALPILNIFIKKKIKAQLGLSYSRLTISGAAPISPAMLTWFSKLNITICEGYALTENFAYGCINTPVAMRFGSIGKPFKDSGFKLSDDGEILFKADILMAGYHNQPKLTREAFDADGYFKTGDIARVDDQGFVFLTGRSKEIFKTTKGKYIAPVAIESLFMAEPAIEQICVMGSGLEQPIALVTIPENSSVLDVKEKLEKIRLKVNEKLSKHEKVSKILIYPDSWTAENGIMTPTLKVKRNFLEQLFNSYYSDAFDATDSVILLPNIEGK